MLTTLNKTLLVLLFTLPAFAETKWECTKGDIRYREFKVVKTIKSEYCYDKTKTMLISKNCLEKKCIDEKLKGKVVTEKLHSTVGNPSFKFCRLVGGSPQIMEFFADKRWWKLNRCIFSEDQTYIDTSYLHHEYRQRQKKKSELSWPPRP